MSTLIQRLSPRTALKAALVLGALLAAGAFDAGRQARAEGAWCADQGGRSGYTNCGYYTFRQCVAAISGVGGHCQPNPNFVVLYPRFYR
jgi:hypothetical protein